MALPVEPQPGQIGREPCPRWDKGQRRSKGNGRGSYWRDQFAWRFQCSFSHIFVEQGVRRKRNALENIWKMKQRINQSAQRNCSSQREWRDLHIQSEAAGKELQRDYANPWLGERWLIARAGGCTHCSGPGQWLCKLHTHSQSAGQLAKWEKLWLCISKCALFSTQTITPRSGTE